MEPIFLHDGRLIRVHDESECVMQFCCIHRPSDHPLKNAPLSWSQEIHSMSRVCEHGLTHPDPDDLNFKAARGEWMLLEAIASVHIDRCDGCCMTEIS